MRNLRRQGYMVGRMRVRRPRPTRTSTRNRTVTINQIYVQDRGAYDLGFKEDQGFLAARGSPTTLPSGSSTASARSKAMNG